MLDHKLQARLQAKGIKVTKQRSAILNVFAESVDETLNAGEVFARVLAEFPQINFSTVYRNLELLTKQGILKKLDLNQGAKSYELAEDRHYHHLVCRLCGETKKIDFCPFKQIKKQTLGGFTPVDHKFEIYGYCKKCQKDNDSVAGY